MSWRKKKACLGVILYETDGHVMGKWEDVASGVLGDVAIGAGGLGTQVDQYLIGSCNFVWLGSLPSESLGGDM